MGTDNKIMDCRMKKLQELMKEENLSGIFFLRPLKGGYNLWLTGGTEKSSQSGYLDTAYLATAGGHHIHYIHTMDLIEAGAEDPYLTHDMPGNPNSDYFEISLGIYGAYFGSILKENPRLGLVNGNYLRVETRDFILKYAPNVEFVDVTAKMNMLCSVKCEEEIELIRKDVRAVERVFAAMGVVLRPGIRERDAVMDIRKKLLEQGANGWESSAQCMDVNLTSAQDGEIAEEMPIIYPGRMLRLGDRVNIEVNASMSNGWQIPLGRVYVMGKASEEALRYSELVKEAQQKAASMLKPGLTIKDAIDVVNKEIYEANGIKPDNRNWIFSISNDWAGYPMAIPGWWDVPLQTGMVLAVAPRVQVDGKDAYCCTDVYEITESGAVRLGKSNQQLTEFFNCEF